MFKEFKVRSALFGLIGGAVVSIVGILVAVEILYTLEHAQKREQETISELRHELSDLDSVLLQARRTEKDFILRLDAKYIEKHATIMEKAHHDLHLITETGTALDMLDEISGVEAANQVLLNYEAAFARLVALKSTLGLSPDQGLEGELRKNVHSAESMINELGSAELLAKVLMMRRHEKDFMLRKDPKYIDRLSERVLEFKAFPDEMFGTAENAIKARDLVDAYEDAFQQFAAGTFEDLSLRSDLSGEYAAFLPVYQELSSALQSSIENRILNADTVRDRFFMTIVISSGIAVVLYFLIGLRLSFALTRPLIASSKALSELSEGKEVGDTSASHSRFLELNQLSNTLEILIVKEQERKALEQEVARANVSQKRVVEQMENGLRRFAEGDLTQTLDEPFDPKYETLRSNFNQTVKTLVGIIDSVIGNAHQIQTSTASISQSSLDLSKRTEGQAATLEETAAALDDLTTSVQATSTGAKEVEGIVVTANATAEQSGEVVREAVEAMSMIEQSSGKISQIISVIDDISFQTNLLALNAGVEAARAGEAGRGFAVVASEVRALALRSSESAQEIKQLISDSSQQVSYGVELVGRTGDELLKIIDSIGIVSTHVAQIAEGVTEQSNALAEINSGVLQLDQVTQRNAAMVEEATSAGQKLSGDAEDLVRQVSVFKTVPTQDVEADVEAGDWDEDQEEELRSA